MRIAAALFSLYGLAVAGCAAGAGAPATAQAEPTANSATIALHQSGAVGGVAVTPLRIEEDSRCPTGVQCVQAGTVRVAVRIEDGGALSESVLTLAQPLWIDGGRRLTLASVCPYPAQPGRIDPGAYRFTFAVGRDGAAPPPGPGCA